MQCEYADRVEQEHLQRFLSHKMADYVWDAQTSTRLEKQVSCEIVKSKSERDDDTKEGLEKLERPSLPLKCAIR